MVTFDFKAVKDAAMNEHSIDIGGCSVLVGDCENRVSIVKIYELPDELPDTILNGVRTARMFIDRPILSQAFITGEFARLWYPLQPKTCRKCGSEDHLAPCASHIVATIASCPAIALSSATCQRYVAYAFLMPTIFQLVLLFTIAQT